MGATGLRRLVWGGGARVRVGGWWGGGTGLGSQARQRAAGRCRLLQVVLVHLTLVIVVGVVVVVEVVVELIPMQGGPPTCARWILPVDEGGRTYG